MSQFKNDSPTIKGNRRKLSNDLILLASLIVSIAILAISLYLFSDDASTVTVTIDGNHYGSYPLDKNVTIDIYSGNNSEYVNRLVIEDGKAFVSFANCPDGICAEHRPISRTGDSIICLPHKVVISAVTNSQDPTPDIVA